MNEIVKISTSIIGNEEINSVNARDIHSYLEVKTKVADWIKRAIDKYDFLENVDYVLTVLKNENSHFKGLEEKKEYIVSLDMAKELAMLENNSKGKEIRKYFIKVEKDYFNSLKQNSNIKELEIYKNKYLESLERENQLLRSISYSNSMMLSKPNKSGTKFTNTEIEKIKELKEQGFTTRQIANIINRSSSGVHNFLKRLKKDKQ